MDEFDSIVSFKSAKKWIARRIISNRLKQRGMNDHEIKDILTSKEIRCRGNPYTCGLEMNVHDVDALLKKMAEMRKHYGIKEENE